MRLAPLALLLVVACGAGADRDHPDRPAWSAEVAGSAGLVGEVDFEEATLLLEGSEEEYLGATIALGDFAAGGEPWVAVAGPHLAVPPATGVGQVRVLERVSAAGGDRLQPRAVIVGAGPDGQFGLALAVVDADGDGADDLAVGWPGGGEGAAAAGRVAVFSGADLHGELTPSDAVFSLVGPVDASSIGTRLATIPGLGAAPPLVVVGAPDERVEGPGPGVVYVWAIPEGASGEYALADMSWTTIVSGTELGDQLGNGLGHGDYDGDGLVDLLVGAPGTDLDTRDQGVVYVFLGAAGFARDPAAADLVIGGDEQDGRLGGTRDDGLGEPDLDGDGYDELVASRPEGDPAIYVWSGAVLGLLAGQLETTTATARFGGWWSNGLGEDMIEACDLDGDGALDFVVGASGGGRKSNGVISWFYGPIRPGHYDVDRPDAWLEHETKEAHMGRDGACADDAGRPDSLLFGAHRRDSTHAPDAGAVYALRGRYR